MSTLVFILALAAVLVLAASWAVIRARRIRAASQARESRAFASALGSYGPGNEGETIFGDSHPHHPTREGIEVAEVVDLDALLADLSSGEAERARARLEAPTDIHIVAMDTFPPEPARTPLLPAHFAAAPAAASGPAPAGAAGSASAGGAPVGGRGTSPAAPAPSQPARPLPQRLAAAQPPQLPAAPTPVSPASGLAPVASDVSLRELTLTWFEARGYRCSPASPAVRPIEFVLRHREDPARAYAVVVESSCVTPERVRELRSQASSIGLDRLLVVAEAGAAPRAAAGLRGVRVVDRTALGSEFAQIDLAVTAKIIAVARKRASVRAAAP